MPDTYCPRYFNHIFSDAAGRYRLCCHATARDNPLEKYNSNTHTPFETFLSPEMEDVRQLSFEGKKIPSCQKCYTMEDAGSISPRLRFRKHEQPSAVEGVEVKLRIFGNHCNLSCVMCAPYNSSTRMQEFKTIGIEPGEYGGFWNQSFEAKPSAKHYAKIKKDILDNIHLVGSIYITGGEPFLLPKHYEFLESIPDKYKKNIVVKYDTNLSELQYKNKSVFCTLEKFKSFSFSVSADHYGDKLAYIRWPLDVEKFENNIEYVQNTFGNNTITSVNCAISILNVEDVPTILGYYKDKFNIQNKGYKSLVKNPKNLNIQHHRDKNKILRRYEDEKWKMHYDVTGGILEYLNNPYNPNWWNQGMEYLERLDKHRGTNFRDLWPNYDYVDLIKVKNIDV